MTKLDVSTWSKDNKSVTEKEMTDIFNQILGYGVKFNQYESEFKGNVIELTPTGVHVKLAKDDDLHFCFKGFIPYFAILTIDCHRKFIAPAPQYIVSMDRLPLDVPNFKNQNYK